MAYRNMSGIYVYGKYSTVKQIRKINGEVMINFVVSDLETALVPNGGKDGSGRNH